MEQTAVVGFALTGSYCTFAQVIPQVERLIKQGFDVIPILSEHVAATDTRFGAAKEHCDRLSALCGKRPICSLIEAEPIGPKKLLDILVIAPCTGNTIAKLASGVADTAVTLSAKSHLRNNRPLVIAISTNDGLGANAKNIGHLMARKHIYLVPFGQDSPIEKENSLVADFSLIPDTVNMALNGKQLQPVLL